MCGQKVVKIIEPLAIQSLVRLQLAPVLSRVQ
eukprot:SAG25_NODE_493_length_7405_cov_1.946756_1_plen_31_part_10